MSENLTYDPTPKELPQSTPDPEGQLQTQELGNKFNALTSSPEVDTAINDATGGTATPYGTDLTATPAYQAQEARVKAMLYDPVNLGGQADQAVVNSQKDSDPQGYRDQVAAFAAVSHLTGSPMSDVVDNYGWYQAQLEKQYKFDPTNNVGTFRKNLQGVFEQHDARAGAIDALKQQAVQDAFLDSENGVPVPPLQRFNDWQSSHQDALKGLSESDKLAAFNSVYKPTQEAINSPDGQLAKKFVDALTGNTPEAKANNYSKEFPTYTDPRKYLRGLPNDQLNKVLGIAQQYVKATHQGQGVGNLGSVYNAFVNSAESFNRYTEVNNLLEAEKLRNAATTPEEKKKYQDQYNDILLAQKVRSFDQNVVNAPPVHKGWKGFVSDTAQGLAGLVPQVLPFLAPVVGEIAFGANEIANETFKRLAENPNMSASEANWRSLVPAAVNTVVGTKGIHLLGKMAPTVVGVLQHTAGSTLLLSAGNLAKTLYAQLENAWNKDINAGEEFAQEYWDIFKNMPSLFVQLGIFGGAMHVLSGGGKVDPEVAKQAAKNAADPMVLKEQGFSHDEATRISELPEDQRIKAITDGWNKRTSEDIEAGKQLQKDNYQQAIDIISSPNAPKLVNNYDGTFHVITMTPEGESHTATFTDKDAAETAYTDAMKDHLQSEYDRTMKEGNDWTTATADDAKTVLDEGRKPSPTITIQVPDIVLTNGDHPSEEIKLSATAEGDESTKAIDLLNTNLQAETEREKAKGNDVSDTTVSAATPEQLKKAQNDPAYKLADRIARLFGKKVVLYNTDKGNAGNGFINTSDALKDYIFLKADGARPHMFTLGHELWHSLSTQHPDLAAKFKAKLLPLIRDMDKVNSDKSHYKESQRVDEVIADFLGNNLGNKDMWDRLSKSDPSLFKTIGDSIKQWLDTVLEKLGGWQMGSNSHFTDIKAARDILANALHEWKLTNDGGTHDPTGETMYQKDKEELKAEIMHQAGIDESGLAFLRQAVGDTKENLQKKKNRKEGTGVAKNLLTRFHDSNGRNIVVGADEKHGGKPFADWIKENEHWLKPEEVTDFRKWYTELKGNFTEIFGDDAPTMMMAWLAAQQNVSPSGALGNVFKVEDRLAGIGTGKKGGLADGKIEGILTNQVPEKGFGQKLTDFVDAGFQRPTRTYMGEKPEGGMPFVADVHTGRDSGHVDQQTLTRLKEMADEGNLFVDKKPVSIEVLESKTVTKKMDDGSTKDIVQPEKIKVSIEGRKPFEMFVDQRGSPSDGNYEGISEWGNNLTDHLNKKEWAGGKWNPAEAQAVGWMRILRQYGLPEPTVATALAHNTTHIYAEVNYSKGNLLPATFPEISSLPKEVQSKITHQVISTAVPELAQIIGGSLRIRSISASQGRWGGESSPSTVIEALSSSESAGLLGNALALVSEQGGSMSAIFEKGGKNSSAIFCHPSDGSKLTPEQLDSLAKEAGISGMTVQPYRDGERVMLVGTKKGTFMPKGLTEKQRDDMTQKISAWAEREGIDLTVDRTQTTIDANENNWNTDKEGESYRQRLIDGGGNSKIRDILDFRRRYAEIVNDAIEQHSPESLTGTREDRLSRFSNLDKPTLFQRDDEDQGGQTLFQKGQPIITGKTPPPPTFREKSEETLKRLQSTIKDLPAASPFKRALLQWSGRSQRSTNEIERAQHEVEKVAPNLVTREGITNWLEAGGDKSLLRLRASTAIEKYKAGYEAALNFTPEQEALANKIKSTFDILLKRGNSWGLDLGTRDNYVPHVYKTEPQAPSGSTPKRLSEFFKFSQERTFDTYHEGESNGYQPETKDIAKLLGLYMNDMSNAINSRRFVEDLRGLKASDGRPLLSGRGSGSETTTDKGTTHLVYPDAADEGTEDYKKLDQPALHDWKFAGKADDGSMILTKGDLAVHPEIATHLNNALSSSAITRWINSKTENPFLNAVKSTVNFGLKAQGYAKGTMLSFSPFHQVQEGIHAIGHRINPFAGLPKIDLRDPAMRDAADHGLMIAHDRLSQSLFMEGVGDNNSNLITMGLRKIGWGLSTKAADTVDAYQHYLFSQYIPSLKFQTYTHIVERNMERYAKDLAAGKVDEWQVKNLSARQANAAYGHLNYTDMGHNPTIRHAMQIVLLAPDFLEARGRFVGQAAKGLVGGKVGAEQLQALAFLAIVQFVGARIFNKLTNDDYEWDHPFEIRVGNKYYGLRSVPEDMYKLVTNTTGFIGGRISPLVGRFIQEGVFGVNYRGEHTTVGDAIADIIAGIVPMSMQSMVGQWTQTGKTNPISWWEQMLTSAGVQIHRYSPITTMYPKAKAWVHANYPENDQKGSYPVSKFQQLRYALEDANEEAVAKQMKILDESGMSHHEITRGFTASVNHPFTGSRATDKQWVKTLDEDDQQRYKAAVERKKEILRRYHQMTGHNPVSNSVEDEQNPE